MTINEEKQVRRYIQNLVRESLNDVFQGDEDFESDPYGNNYKAPMKDEFENGSPKMLNIYKDEYPEGVVVINPEAKKDDPNRKVFIPKDAIKIWKEDYVAVSQNDYKKYCIDGDDNEFSQEESNEEPAGINELRRLAESFAREAVRGMLTEKKKKSSTTKKASKDATIMAKLNSDGVNSAAYFYKLYGVENGTEAEKASARSKGYKKAKGKKNDTGVPYKFTTKEKNRLTSLLTDR